MGGLDGKVAIVTGAARGLGAACARRLVAEGASVVVADVLVDDGAALADELGDRGRFKRLDVTSEPQWDAVASAAIDGFGSLDALVNNAGVLRRTPIIGGSREAFVATTEVNQLGVYLGMKAVAPLMRDRGGGSIVNISSIDGMIGMVDMSAYVATKWAVRGMTKVAAMELGPHGIRCNSVHPGYIDSDMLTRGGRLTDSQLHAMAQSVPSRRLGSPDDIAQVCAFLISDASGYCNGAELTVDGGLIAGIRPQL
jgi:3alpha(or 20beta)-hydroxysteroid dehydrogenase